MINSTNTVNIDGTVLNDKDFTELFTLNSDDKFSLWVVRPIAILATVGMGVAMFFASAFLIVLGLAMLPLLALAIWAVKTKIQRDLAKNDPVVDTQDPNADEPKVDAQATP